MSDRLDQMVGRLQGSMDALHDKVDKIDAAVIGTPGHPGAIVRVDRLEQKEKRRERWAKTALGVALASFFGMAVRWLQ